MIHICMGNARSLLASRINETAHFIWPVFFSVCFLEFCYACFCAVLFHEGQKNLLSVFLEMLARKTLGIEIQVNDADEIALEDLFVVTLDLVGCS